MEDNIEFQKTKWGDFVLILDYPTKEERFQTVEIKTRTEQYFQSFKKDGKILFELMGNIERTKAGSSFLECKADLYAYGFVNGAMNHILDAFIFRVPETQRWLKANINRFPQIKSSTDSLYSTSFVLIPLIEIPRYCILEPPKLNSMSLNDLFWDSK